MNKRLIVRLNPQDPSQLEWKSPASDGADVAKSEWGTFERFADLAKGKRVILLVPGRDLLITEVKLPEGSQRTLAHALPYALEERLIEDVDDLHFVAAPRQSDGYLPVAVIQRQTLTDLVNTFLSAGIHLDRLLPQPLALLSNEDTWSLLFEGDQVLVRTGKFSGFECPTAMLRILLNSVKSEQRAEDTAEQSVESLQLLHVYGEVPDSALVNELEEDGFSLRHHSVSGLSALTQIENKQASLNLLQGFKTNDGLSGGKANWWPAVILSLLAFVIYMAASGYQYWMLQQQEEVKKAQLTSLFKSSFPEVKRIVDPMQQAKQRLEQRRREHGQGEDGLLSLLYRVGQALQGDRTLAFQTIEFREGVLQLRMQGKSVESIERFKQRIEKDPTITVEILSTVVQGADIEARLKIRGRAA